MYWLNGLARDAMRKPDATPQDWAGFIVYSGTGATLGPPARVAEAARMSLCSGSVAILFRRLYWGISIGRQGVEGPYLASTVCT